MPNPFIDNRDRWLSLAEIDYLGHFVKAWLGFNAWYRSVSVENQDRKIINDLKWQPNAVLSRMRPLLTTASEEAEQFRAEIGMLHQRLENYELHCGKGDEKERITLTNIYIKDNSPSRQTGSSRGYNFSVERRADKQVHTEVLNRTNNRVFYHHQQKFDLADLEAQSEFQNSLTQNLQSFLRQLYQQVAPKCYANLISGNNGAIKCGAYDFRCGRDNLFAGILEAIYLMRCSLFHGELVPTREATACYEPAYRLVRRFIESVS